MKLNKDKLPIKYILGIEKDLPGYPNDLDIMYHEVGLCERMPDRYKGNFTLHAVSKYHFPETDKEHLKESINGLIELGLVEQTCNEDGKESYTILINPFE